MSTQPAKKASNIAYFTMEVGLENHLPTYSGGLGVLAGDTLKSAADLALPVVGVTLLHRKGYFRQSIDASGQQQEEAVRWNPEEFMKPVAHDFSCKLYGKDVKLKAWRYDVQGVTGHIVPVYFIDAALAENSPEVQGLTDQLYGGDNRYRIAQEVLLGMGGVALLNKLGLAECASDPAAGTTFHMNEGHASFLTLGLTELWTGQKDLDKKAVDRVRKSCVFTTHTPVPAGHDRFTWDQVEEALGKDWATSLERAELKEGNELNMTHLALRCSRYVNGVAKRHGEVSREMFPGYKITAITNGVHARTWVSPHIGKVFDKYTEGWRQDNHFLRSACELPLGELWTAHLEAKKELFAEVKTRCNVDLDPKVLTIGFARRAATYKRGDLVFHDVANLRKLAETHGKIQLVFAGKAHPKDEGGKAVIKRIVERSKELQGTAVEVVYLDNYDMRIGALITAGVDVWLNNPVKPLEASGTSGMKAALNGVPSLSTLDGWWVEGCIEGITGWEIEDAQDGMKTDIDDPASRAKAAEALYAKLGVVCETYYKGPERFKSIMRNSIFVNGTFFTTQRMVEQYERNAYSISG